jgi:hypothetical protein
MNDFAVSLGQQPSPATVLRMLREPFQLPVFCRVSSWLGNLRRG